MKGRGIAHKTESGNIRSGLNSFCEVNVAARAMNSNTFLVEEMVDGLVCELMLGVIRDTVDGFILTLAAGGVMTKLMCYQVSQVPPVNRKDIVEALCSLKIYKVLSGYGGTTKAHLDSIVQAVLAVQC